MPEKPSPKVNLIVILVTGSVLTAATWKLSADMQSKAEDHLKTEIAVTAEWNRQHAVMQDLEKRLKAEAEKRESERFVGQSIEFYVRYVRWSRSTR